MSNESIDQDKFDAILRRLINTPPSSMAAAKAAPKLKKDGQPKKGKAPNRRKTGPS
jgi:hypothetical protein